ncbi:MAG: bifunctional DNA-formamidopyrimidine glycosylase/DNA-(apurinic or apyrimidinic site) lyase [Parcubacteria group bacterium CG07_land_8_20_14_0_80_35_11]|uniref:Bifunctional DNA-formamidopyrimidine glycosylase/DNA-(Apurinic or apyrimidinic site) lyase n=1 Tax=Candidatus Shapirobacteria bacterium CG_4_9_14_0_2_um_filter_39_11 TaxID=1974478 RepID=A0A2M8ERZ9_9BACT|nr:MAG: bifunctional DNA-formamidopyrimidine glycosylase/DNA-(apurinic or apyrimidinic site) lyase [Parcubacteria group bacterium CG07_land_8_20_14_0_80_35_11]PJC27901.1 MAG: bifunctional DNA-formamidopyrimidine glycosylase/DNA-(apurinic or apyrimidinic site) lyase [Candidatus Shapirobacteria bacterium CG_4_9_14_0_2_um_filter_39_11]
MPELPEVETIKRSLQKSIVGKKITGVQVLLAKQFQGKREDVLGAKITGIERRGKILIISLSNGKNLLIHFKLTGQLVWIPKAGERATLGHPIPFAGAELPAKTTHIIFEIDGPPSPKASARQGGRLFFNDLRQFGWIKLVDSRQVSAISNQLGIEPFDEEFTVEYLEKIFSKTSKPIKLVLMDQGKIAGIGNIYANEALWEAGIDPRTPAKKLPARNASRSEAGGSNLAIEQLREAIIKILEDGLKYGGSSAKDEAYIKPTGEAGEYQKHFRVYQRAGQACPRCGGKIQRIELGGRGTFLCPGCQK